MDKIRNLNVMVEPTSSCNLDCAYCYKGPKKKQVMTFEMVQDLIRQVISYTETQDISCEFVWHGGEPTLVGAKFYKQVFNFIDKIKCKHPISHSIQTNGTLLTDELLDIFSKYRVDLGVSLDDSSPKHHEKMRPHVNNKPTYGIILDGIKRAKKMGINVRVLMSITKSNSGNVKEMFEFCRQNQIDLGFNPVAADLHSAHADIAVTPEDYLKVCIESFDLWFYQKNAPIRVNPGFGIVEALLSKKTSCLEEDNCQMSYVSIGPEGEIYPCSRFYGVREFEFGNVSDGFEKAMNSEKRNYLLNRCSSQIPKCRNCHISFYCNGGCMHHAEVHYGSIYSPDHLCMVYRGLMNHAITRLKEIL